MLPPMQRPGRCALLAGSIALTLAGAPAAEAAWTTPARVSDAGVSARAPQVGVDLAGNTTLVWEAAAPHTIRSAYRPAGGPWEGSFTRMPAISDCSAPELAVNATGAAVVVADCGTGAETMRAAYRPAGGSWSSSVAIPGSGAGADPRVGLDAAGNAIVVWESAGGVQSAYRPAAGPWAGPAAVSPAGDVALDPDVAMSATGAALAVWRHELNRTPTDPVVTVESSIRRGAAAWTGPTVLTRAATSTVPVSEGEPRVRWNADGDRVAVWANRPTGEHATLLKRWGTGGDFGGWGGSPLFQEIGDGATDVEVPQVGLAADGGAVAVWRSFDAVRGFRTQGATTSAINGAWTPPALLADAETGLAEPQVAVAPSGRATALWTTLSPRINAATRPAGGGFQPAATISTPGSTGAADPRVVMTDAGDAVGTWSEADTGVARIAVAVDDVTPPALSAVTVPATATTGASVAMSAAASDTWSPVTISWTLGDGTAIAGAAVSHAYATPGTRTVTVTATDAAGNTAAQTRTIAVAAPPAGAPPAPGGSPAGPTPVTLAVSIPRQSWRSIRRAKAVKLRCSLDVPGTCAVTARLKRATAKRLGLARRVGRRSAAISRQTTIKVRLSRKVRRAIGRTRRRVALTLTVTGTAPGRTPATLTRKLTIKRR